MLNSLITQTCPGKPGQPVISSAVELEVAMVDSCDEMHNNNLSFIRGKDVRVAYLYLVRVAQNLAGYRCMPNMKGVVRTFRYYCGDEQPFAFIVNADSLLFYLRKPATSRFSVEDLTPYFSEVKVPRKDEITVRINNQSAAQLLMWRIFGFRDA